MAKTIRQGFALLTGVCQLRVIMFGFSIVPFYARHNGLRDGGPLVTSTTQPGSTSHFALSAEPALLNGSDEGPAFSSGHPWL